jgi:hypothetical protein
MTWQRYNVSAAKAIIPKLKHLLETFRQADFPIYHTREGQPSMLPDSSVVPLTLCPRPSTRPLHPLQPREVPLRAQRS